MSNILLSKKVIFIKEYIMNLNYKAIGEMGQNCVIGEFSKFGLGIGVLLSDNYPFDFIAIAGEKLFKIQVKTSSRMISEGSISFELQSNNFYTGTIKKYSKEDCDIIACYDMVNNMTCLLSPKEFENKSAFTIRFKEAKNGNKKTINWYEDYVISSKRIKEVFNYDAPNFKMYHSYAFQEKYTHICLNCKKEFISSYKRAKYCNSACKGQVSRKIKWPEKEKLIELIKTNSITNIGKQFGVSDNAIRKWAIKYGIDIKALKISMLK